MKLDGNKPPKSSILAVSNKPANGFLAVVVVVVVVVVADASVGNGCSILNPGGRKAEMSSSLIDPKILSSGFITGGPTGASGTTLGASTSTGATETWVTGAAGSVTGATT